MGDIAQFAECTDIDISGDRLERGPTRDEMTTLLRRIAAAARPRDRNEQSLAHLIHVLRRCAWLEGELRMEIEPNADQTSSVHFYTEYGGIRERALPAVCFATPFTELAKAIGARAELFAPLTMQLHKGKVVLTPTGIACTIPPQAIEVDADSTPHEKETVRQPKYELPTLADAPPPFDGD